MKMRLDNALLDIASLIFYASTPILGPRLRTNRPFKNVDQLLNVSSLDMPILEGQSTARHCDIGLLPYHGMRRALKCMGMTRSG